LEEDIGEVEDKLGVNDRPQTTASRPGTTRAKTGRGTRAQTAKEDAALQKKGAKNLSNKIVSEVSSVEQRMKRKYV
jgi:hypothetical protein